MKNFVIKSSSCVMIFFVMISVLFLGIRGEATDTSSSGSDMGGATGFIYKIEYPENQLSGESGYFDLLLDPGQEQTLKLVLSNPSTEDIKVALGINGAKTNSNGVLDYGETEIADDESLPAKFTEVVTGPEQVELAAGETKEIDLQVVMPAEAFEGILAGGIQLMKIDSKQQIEENEGSAVVNRYVYVIALLLRNSEDNVQPELQYRETYASQDNYRNAIMTKFSNIKGAYVNGMAIEVQITQKGKQKVLYERKEENMRMAPNTLMAFPTYLNGEEMVAGDYQAHIVVTANDDMSWEWNEEFTITQEEAAEFNKRDAGLTNQKGFNWKSLFLWLFLFVAVVVAAFIGLQFWKKRKGNTIASVQSQVKKTRSAQRKGDKGSQKSAGKRTAKKK